MNNLRIDTYNLLGGKVPTNKTTKKTQKTPKTQNWGFVVGLVFLGLDPHLFKVLIMIIIYSRSLTISNSVFSRTTFFFFLASSIITRLFSLFIILNTAFLRGKVNGLRGTSERSNPPPLCRVKGQTLMCAIHLKYLDDRVER